MKRVGLFVSLVLAVAACGKKTDGEGSKGAAPASAAKSAAASAAPDSAAASAAAQKGDAAPAAELDLPAGPIAKVNGVEVDREEFVKKYSKMTKAFTTRKKEIPEGLAKRYKQSILKQLVDKELLSAEVKKRNIQVPAADLETEFADYKKMFRTDENFDRYLKSSDITEAQIKENISHNLAVTKLLEDGGDLKVSDEEIKAYYDKNQARYEIKEQVRASHILLKVDKSADEAAVKAAKDKADKIYAEASKKGADFAELAKKNSEGPTAPRGGDLSYFSRGRMVPEFEKAAFALKVGEISKPVKTQFGWHIIKITDKKEGKQRSFDEVKESIAKLLRNKNSRKAKSELLKKLKDGAKIEVMLPDVTLDPKPLQPTMPGSAADAAGEPADDSAADGE
ncbi:MAG: peptidylprolyl isomerase [Myxococcales bacterium]|nr:peptidylprolyl isomerase [Myxococcales bacterium]